MVFEGYIGCNLLDLSYKRGWVSVQTGAIALVLWLMLSCFFRSGRKASSYLLASERTKHLR
jgi:hypothetical protein